MFKQMNNIWWSKTIMLFMQYIFSHPLGHVNGGDHQMFANTSNSNKMRFVITLNKLVVVHIVLNMF
jgi:hypothetical protein